MKNDYKKKIIILLNILIPLVSGGAAYICFRPDTYVSDWFYSVFKEIDFNYFIRIKNSQSGRLFVSYFSDICWAYSLSFAVYYSLNVKHKIKMSFLISVLFCTAVECAQAVNIISGTFDILDIVTEAAVCMISHLIIHVIEEKIK